MKLTKEDLKELFKMFEESDKQYRIAQNIKNKRIKDNFKALNQKAKELGKEIPDYLAVIVYLDQTVGSWVFEEYKEWLE